MAVRGAGETHPRFRFRATIAEATHHGRMEAPAEGGSSFQVGATAHATSGSPVFCEAQRPLPPLLEGRPRERLVELHTSFRELFTFFCANATIHGAIRLVCSSQNGLKTASWGLLLVGALGVFYWQFGLLLARYWRYPVIMTVSVHSELRLFPAVTLCDMNPHRPRSARYHLQVLDEFARENIHSLYKFNFSENRDVLFADDRLPQPAFYLDRGIRLERLSQPGGQNKVGFRLCNSTGGDCFYRAFSSAVTAVRQWYRFHYVNILALMPPAREDSHHSHGGHFVFSCRFDGQDCQAWHFQTSHHPSYGSCYTFSGVSAAQHPGITHGISLVLRAGQQDHLPLLSTEAGIKVMIHGHDHTPFLEHQGFSIRPGTETTVGIREDEVHRLGGPYSHCTKGAEGVDVQLLYNASYTLQACLVSCFQQLMVETCSCGYYFYPLPSGAEYCSYARHPAWGHCFYRLYRDLGTHRLPCTSRCPRPCRESSYKLSAGTSRWPSSKSADWILAVLGKRRHRSLSQSPGLRSNVAKVNIFYQELNYHTVDETPVYSVPQLLSATGSLWSLWFGSSVLSVLELLELLLDAIALTLLRGCRWLRGARGSQPGAATVASHAKPEANQLPADHRDDINHLGGPAGLISHDASRSSGRSLC
ncbi:amiloride-sensitive sodium channel subunit delta [Zalophus californianus]|uniref:Amiloride-sensitive sodium channel subunit delta n=1 Tax=Zalophus californianus TaxID=9704 RepID=A0A6J2EP64_ZALCA|nr:amiloride-sensitive sodium channel subunit delta [Zalophus californianus]